MPSAEASVAGGVGGGLKGWGWRGAVCLRVPLGEWGRGRAAAAFVGDGEAAAAVAALRDSLAGCCWGLRWGV